MREGRKRIATSLTFSQPSKDSGLHAMLDIVPDGLPSARLARTKTFERNAIK